MVLYGFLYRVTEASIHGSNLATAQALHNGLQQLVFFWGHLLVGGNRIEDLLLLSTG